MSNWTAFGFSAVVNFFLSPYIVHRLGDTGYGIWVLLASLVGYMGLLDLGVRGAVTRYVAKYHALGADDRGRRTASAALAIFTAASGLAIALSVIVAALVSRLFHIPPEYVKAARIVVVLGGAGVAVSLIGGVFGGVVTALQRFDLSSGLEIGVGALRATAIVLALNAGFGLIGLASIQVGVSMLRATGQYIISRRHYPALTYSLFAWERSDLREIFSYSFFSSLLQLSGMLVLYADSVVIGAFVPVAMITFFAIAANLTNYARDIIAGISQTVTPRVSALEGRGDEVAVGGVSIAAARIATLVLLPIVATFIIRGGTFIGLWMGPRYAALSGAILTILSIALWFTPGRQVATAALLGVSRHRDLIPVVVGEAAVNLACSVWWIHDFGIVGVAWGTVVPYLVVSVILVPRILAGAMRTSVRQFAWEVWARPGLAVVPFAAVSMLIERSWRAENLPVFFLQVLLTLPAWALGAWVIGLTDFDRKTILAPIRRALRLV